MRSVSAPPKPSILIESMRDVGYTLETAIADIIDNSISAGAGQVHIHVDTTAARIRLAIVDNGRGMTEAELHDSMRLGSRHPREQRGQRDLGRFGLGLKTASFSQCRRLSVITRRAGRTSAAIWDLDYVAEQDRWDLLIPENPTEIPFADKLGAEGTLVVWEKLDRAVEQGESEAARRHFVRRVDETRTHLELVFHRFLAGEPGVRRVDIRINELPLKPFDPFHSRHQATHKAQTETVPVGDQVVEITAFTLPHHRNVTAAQWEHYGGPGGYLKNQGFYLYREKRLIIHGTWFGLARQSELTKLTRVRIDSPNALDSDWHVDVKKAFARPPLQVRERLQNLIRELGAPSRVIYTRRGQRLYSTGKPLWERVQENNSIVYRVNEENPIVSSLLTRLPEPVAREAAVAVRAIGAGIPLDAIFADLAGNPEQVHADSIDEESLSQLLSTVTSQLRSGGFEGEELTGIVLAMEPFRSNREIVETLLADIETE